jgi:hypothetical protein
MISHSDLFTSFFASFGVCGLILRALVLTLTLHGLIFQMRPFSKWNRRERLTICAHHFGNGSSCGNTRTPKLLAFHWTSWDILRTWNDTYIIYIYIPVIYQLYTRFGVQYVFHLSIAPQFYTPRNLCVSQIQISNAWATTAKDLSSKWFHSHMLHVWYIYLHLGVSWGKCW